MTAYTVLQDALRAAPRPWLVTGAAGFIGSHLVETLLALDQWVVGLDNFSTGKASNLDQVRAALPAHQADRLQFVEGDIRNTADCTQAMRHAQGGAVRHVLHQAALGSVPRSLLDPQATHDSNVTGFLSLLVAARDAQVESVVYASSSSVYGDHPALPKVEAQTGRPLSPYAASKVMNELYAGVFHRSYGLRSIGLRYFNVFGPRQDPAGAYAAVIPRWCDALLRGQPVQINGDGSTSRDFCFVANAVQANLLAATVTKEEAFGRAYNVACGARTDLNDLFRHLRDGLQPFGVSSATRPVFADFRAGDVRHSLADITAAGSLLGYVPSHDLAAGLREALPWYVQTCQDRPAAG